MLPAQVRIRPPRSVSVSTHRPPYLRVIEGGRSTSKEEPDDPLRCFVFLIELAKFRYRRRHQKWTPTPWIPPDPNRRPKRPKQKAKLEEKLRAEAKKLMIGESGIFSLKVLHHYVRRVLGEELGVWKLLCKKAELAMTKARSEFVEWSRREKLRRKFYVPNTLSEPASVTYEEAWKRALYKLVADARSFIATAQSTGKRTGKGFHILRAHGANGDVFVTIHHLENSVVAIYTDDQFTRKRGYRNARRKSHGLAELHRKRKAAGLISF